MIETLHKGAKFKKIVENISSQLQVQTEVVEPQPKKQKTQLVPK